jgi:outer membrane lipase/esterase
MTTTRRRWHISALAAAALIVAGCGGGNTDSPLATRVVVFGDSLSDIGAYTPATQIPIGAGQNAGEAPYFGGKFTTNTHTGYSCQRDATGALVRDPVTNSLICSNSSTSNTWVEWIAARLGVAITPALVGFGPPINPVTGLPGRRACPVAATIPALAGSCTGYAQGGSRVTSPAGIGNPNGNGINGASPAPMTVPMVTQVADHLTAFTSFGSDDIVFVFGGNNDVFVQFGLVGAGAITPEDAGAALQTAATELATLVKDEILAKGAKRVAVMTLPDSATTPFGSTLSAEGRGLLTALSAGFNTALLAGLDGSGAKIIDARTLNAAVQASPSSFGLTNITTPACNAQIIAGVTGGRITDGSSLFCNAAPAALFAAAGVPSLNAITPGASASTYLFADGVHPTTAGHKIFADQVWTQLKNFGWAPDNL